MTAVLLGLFDSVHMGHLQALEYLRDIGAQKKLVYTFNNSSLDTKGQRTPLITDKEKKALLKKAGADRVISVDFALVRDLTPEQFVCNILIGELNAHIVIAGENFRFGKNASGDINTLESICYGYGLRVISVPLAKNGGGVISTTRIRNSLETGDIDSANSMLGRRYAISESVTHGNALGRELGIKTVNQNYDGCLKAGVYATVTEILGKKYKSVTNVGYKPTVSVGKVKNAETHILGFDENVYGKKATVEFIKFYREESKFPDRESLVKAIENDIRKRREENE